MRWNPTRASNLLASGRAVLHERAARTGQHDSWQWLPPAAPHPRAPLAVADDEDEEERRVENWLKVVSQPARATRPAPPGDFTARVMARLEAGPVVAPRPIARANARATMIEHLCLVGGVFSVSTLLVATTCVLTALLAPNAVFTVLNALVGAVVFVFTLLGPLLDALGALTASPPFMCALLTLVAGALVLWSRVLHLARLPGEA